MLAVKDQREAPSYFIPLHRPALGRQPFRKSQSSRRRWQGLGKDAAAGRKLTCMKRSVTDTLSDVEKDV